MTKKVCKNEKAKKCEKNHLKVCHGINIKKMVIPVKEKDYLEQDPPIRGQNFACLSFISPEDLIKQKECFQFENYLQKFSTRMNELVDGIEKLHPESSDMIRAVKEQYAEIFSPKTLTDDFKFYVTENATELDREFNELYDFQTNIRGIKVRGVYESLQEAQARCQQLRQIDNDKFNIYISEMGTWCPWSPNPSEIKDQEFAIDSLNTMMKDYEQNVSSKNEEFNARKKDLQDRMSRQTDIDSLSDIRESLEKTDPKTDQMASQH